MWIGGDALMLIACITITVVWVKWETIRTKELDIEPDAQGLSFRLSVATYAASLCKGNLIHLCLCVGKKSFEWPLIGWPIAIVGILIQGTMDTPRL